MTIYGWDMSHYDAANIGNAVAQGISFITHKAGGDALDAELDDWWAGVRNLPQNVILGAYWVLYPGSPSARADTFLSVLDARCPGWRSRDAFILQIDAEVWGGDQGTKPSISECNAFADRVVARTDGKYTPIGYLPKWVYGNVASFRYPLWASAYVSGSGGFKALYPGDNSSKWNSYGKPVTILQYSSSATIGGQTTCDANAYRGSVDQLKALVTKQEEDMVASQDMIDAAEQGVRNVLASAYRAASGTAPAGDPGKPDRNARDQMRAVVGGPVDQSVLLAAIASDNVDTQALADALLPGLTAAVVAAIPDGTLTEAEVETAVRNVLGSLNDA